MSMFEYCYDSDDEDGSASKQLAPLIGAVVREISYTKDCDSFEIRTDRGEMAFQAVGDCCSQSWFQAFDDFEILIGRHISSIEERVEERDTTGNMEAQQEETNLYGCVFSCASGSAYLELRNDSNGYYGGSVRLKWRDGEAS